MVLKRKVLVGMSGGVDSSVSAALLLEQGYEVIGGFMKNWSGSVDGPSESLTSQVGLEHEECGWRAERRDAMRVAAKLGIPFFTFDFEKEYRAAVVEDLFLKTEAGRTPNPDVLCNRAIKFDLFVKEADHLGCDWIATGHYARIKDGRLLCGTDSQKDQSYFLWAIPRSVLSRVIFPVGGMQKAQVRQKARALGLSVADKKDSTGICFVGEVQMRSFLQGRLPKRPGAIVTTDGKVVGSHEGVIFYTIGQRHGLEIGGGSPYYVVEKRVETNELVVSSNFHPALFHSELTATQLNWFRVPQIGTSYQGRIRYRQPLQSCKVVSIDDERIQIHFDEPQRAVTPGQSVVLYDLSEMLGGGIISDRCFRNHL